MKTIVNEKEISKRLGDVLLENQGSKGNTEYANFLGITASALNNYNKGRLPQLEQLIKIRNNLKLPFGYLLAEIDVTSYNHDTDNTFGLSKECIRKLETFDKEELNFISNFIQSCPKELITILCKFSKLPLIDKDISKIYYAKDDKSLSPAEVTNYRIENDYLQKYIMIGIENTINSLKLPSEELHRVFDKPLKNTRDELSKMINDPQIYAKLVVFNQNKRKNEE